MTNKRIQAILKKHALGTPLTESEKKTLRDFKSKARKANLPAKKATKKTAHNALEPIPRTFPSMRAVSGALGIPIAVLQKAKRAGCPAFHQSNRVDLLVFIKWYFTRETETDVDQKERLTRVQADLYETKNRLAQMEEDLKTGRLVDIDEVDKLLKELHEPLAQQLKTLANRLDARVNPTDPQHAHLILEEETRALFSLAQEAHVD